MKQSETLVQFSCETRGEYFRNEWRRGRGKLLAYLKNRYQWQHYPGRRIVAPFPLNVDIEVSSRCQIRCDHCFRQYMDIGENDFMPLEMYRKIVTECGRHGLFTLKFSMRGEPLMHPDIVEMVALAKAAGIPEVWINTNGGMLTETLARGLLLAGVDWITMSFDGLGPMYESIRKPLKYEESLEKLKMLRRLRDQTASGSKCYKYRWSVDDNYGNTTTSSETSAIVRVPLTTIAITGGNNQSYGNSANNPIGYTLPTALEVQVTDGGSNWALAGEVTVDFAFNAVPGTPTATGQSLGSYSDNTDANGKATTTLTFGDRAGNYTVDATSTHTSITVEPTFTETAGQHFSLVVTEANMSIDLNALSNDTDSASPTVTVTTNAASYQVALTPDQWPLSAALDEILNWATLLGFGWDLNSGTITAYSESAGDPALTTVYTCSGDTCQGANVIDINLNAAIDSGYAPGAYQSTITFSGESISY